MLLCIVVMMIIIVIIISLLLRKNLKLCGCVSIAVLRPSLEPPHAVVPFVPPLDHYRSLRQHQPVAALAVVLLAQDQVEPACDGTKLKRTDNGRGHRQNGYGTSSAALWRITATRSTFQKPRNSKIITTVIIMNIVYR